MSAGAMEDATLRACEHCTGLEGVFDSGSEALDSKCTTPARRAWMSDAESRTHDSMANMAGSGVAGCGAGSVNWMGG